MGMLRPWRLLKQQASARQHARRQTFVAGQLQTMASFQAHSSITPVHSVAILIRSSSYTSTVVALPVLQLLPRPWARIRRCSTSRLLLLRVQLASARLSARKQTSRNGPRRCQQARFLVHLVLTFRRSVVTKVWLGSLSSTQRRAGHRHRPMRKLGGVPSRSTALQLQCPPRQWCLWCPNRQLDVLPSVVVLPLSRSSSRSPSPSPSPCLSQSKFRHPHVHLATLSSRRSTRVPFQLLHRRVASHQCMGAERRTRDRTDMKTAQLKYKIG